MKVSLNWMKELLPGLAAFTADLPALCDRLDMTGTGVEGITNTGAALDRVVVGQITDKVKHPNADTLWVTTVDVGQDEPLQIVCGAQNFNAGDKVPVALVGASLPNGVTIKKSKLRGEVSCGMNCSARELGLGDDADGILILPEDAPVGMAFGDYRGISDTILDLEITPNRPDCLSMRGLAREFSTVLGIDDAVLPPVQVNEVGGSIHDAATVTVAEPELCPRYTARLIRNVKIGPSPAWLAERVQAAGARSINNVVDITNYIMFLTGQPLHAFDYDRIAKGDDGRAQVIIRRAHAGETITTLDDQLRRLTPANQLITDPSGPITLAGVMGAENTEVKDDTVNIFLEAAVFQPEITSRTSRGFALLSEASLRYERGVDIEQVLDAQTRACALMAELCGGEVAPDVIDVYPTVHQRPTITLRGSRVQALIGERIARETCEAMLTGLGLTVQAAPTPKAFDVTIPAFRPDLTREVDLIEELLRLHGMERIQATMPRTAHAGGLSPRQRLRARLETVLRAGGLNETMTLPFADPADGERFGLTDENAGAAARLHNPMASDASELRRLLITNLLHSVALNLSRGTRNVALYEVGAVFTATEGRKQPKEAEHIAAVLTGSWDKTRWNEPERALDFYDAKGILELVVRELAVNRFQLKVADPARLPFLQPGRAADIVIAGQTVGFIGELHPALAAQLEIDQPVAVLEFATKPLLAAARDSRGFVEPSRFPGIDLDIALVVDESVQAGTLVERLLSAGKKTPLARVRLFDVYRGAGIAEGKKSLALTLSYRAQDRTLTAQEIEPIHERIVQKAAASVGAELRS
ncbi:MAG: phenylalanine--tRNA ligase subunit beta [Actinomycetes bacterium]|jgi:phenylalanyl-tRNA synthetase beta chain|nr:phenylalanine--tRNA ligase subunit beta [Actinomycetes bacterium]